MAIPRIETAISTAAAAARRQAPLRPPPLLHLALEWRCLPEYLAFAALYRRLRLLPGGDGHPVLALPGLLASDWSTQPLRRLLRDLGYAAHGWELGVNKGPRPGMEAALVARLEDIVQRHGRRASLVGTSLGGIYARQLAKAKPHLVRSVITLGSPFAKGPRATRAWRLYEYFSGASVETCDRHMGGALRLPPPVPATAIYSRTDGICAWQGCMERPGPMAENIAVPSSHIGLIHHPLALHAVADRLGQPEGTFRPYAAATWRDMVRLIRQAGRPASPRAT